MYANMLYTGEQKVASLKIDDSDSNMAMLQIFAWDQSDDANTPYKYRTITIDNNGSGGSKLIILINQGASSTDYNQYQFSAYATGISDPDGVDASPTHTQCTTLGALITAINALTGIKCWRKHAPSDKSLDSDDFVDLTKTDIYRIPTDILYPDVSELTTAYLRFGVPEYHDNGDLAIVYLRGKINLNTSCTIKIYKDPDEVSATNRVCLFSRAVNASTEDNVEVAFYDFSKSPMRFRGPILVEVTNGAAWSTDTGELTVQYVNAGY